MFLNQNRQVGGEKMARTLLDGSSGWLDGSSGGASVFDFSILTWNQGSH